MYKGRVTKSFLHADAKSGSLFSQSASIVAADSVETNDGDEIFRQAAKSLCY